MWNAASSEQWRYDQRGRLIGETKTITGIGTFSTTWGYDSLNRVTWQQYPKDSVGTLGELVQYTYRPVGLLQTVIGVDAPITTTYVGDTQYNALGQVTLRNLGSAVGVVGQRYTYPPTKNYRLGALTSGVPGKSYKDLQNITYTYDNVGNVLTIFDDALVGGPQTQRFTYDTLDRLATASSSGQTQYGAYAQQSYGYAPNGNLIRFNSATANQEYKDAAHSHAVTMVTDTATGARLKYVYDANGNATTRTTASGATTNPITTTYEFAYDFENRVTELKQGGSLVSAFQYDGDGNRIVETSGVTTTVYLGNYYEWTKVNGTASAKSYYYAGNVRVAMRDATGVRFLLGDHLGSTTLTTNSAGVRQAELRYYPYGKTRFPMTTTNLPAPNPPTSFRFTGQRQQANTNELYFYQSRWYDPLVGRFLSPDTIVPDPQNPQSLNRYSYVGNSPLRYVDPSGHAWIDSTDSGGSDPGCWACALQSAASTGQQYEPIRALLVTAASFVSEPIDWISTGYTCVTTGCNPALAALSLLPFIPGSASGRLDNAIDAATEANRVYDAVHSVDRVAFGLAKHPNHARGGLIGRFSEKVGASTWWDLYESAPDLNTMGGQLLDMMGGANEDFFKKTVFYLNGKPVSGVQMLP